MKEVVEYMGADRVIFGSDWPHIEGLPQPLDYLVELEGFDAESRRKILHDNARELNELLVLVGPGRGRPRPPTFAQARGLRCARRFRGACRLPIRGLRIFCGSGGSRRFGPLDRCGRAGV